MSTPLLTTKLYIPQNRPELIPRGNQLEKLNQGMDRKLTLLSAPAGYGKTTLVSEWSSQSQVPFCWVTLDKSDNDIGRFLAYYMASLQTINISVDEQLLSLIHSPQQTPIESILIPLINQIAEIQHNFVIVLDDYHFIHDDDIHKALCFILENAPPLMHHVISTRADPPLPIARMRARGQVAEVRVSNLKFSVDDGNTLLNQVHGFALSSADIKTLINRVGGWAAALHMISIALKEKSNPSKYIQEISGTSSYIADYLTDEVISQQPDIIQEFLVLTSFLNQLSGSLCDAVTKQENSSRLLKHLIEGNLFITPMDDECQWYRYHRLFANLLQQRLLEAYPNLLPELHLRASHWFENYGSPWESIEYALRGGHTDRAASLIEKNAIETLTRSELNTYLRWVEKLPQETLSQKGLLAVLYAWAVLVVGGKKEIAKSVLDSIIPEENHLAYQVDTVRSVLAIFEGQISDAVDYARCALDHLPEQDHFFRNIAAWNLSGALAVSGDTEGGLDILWEVVKTSLSSSNYLVATIALCRLGISEMLKGNLHKARDLFQQALEISTSNQEHPMPVASEALMGLGKIYWEWNLLDSAHEYLHESIALSKKWRDYTAIDSCVALAHLQQTMHEEKSAGLMMSEAQKLASQTLATDSDDKFVASHSAHLYIRQGKLESARRWVADRGLGMYLGEDSLELSGSIGADVVLLFELIVYARLLIAEKKVDTASNLLNLVLPPMERLGYVIKIIEIHMLIAVAQYAGKNTTSALKSFERALNLAEPGDFKRVFLDEGDIIINLLEGVSARGSRSEFVNKLINSTRKTGLVPVEITGLVDPLSEREIEILRMLKTDLSAPEIAEKLHIAVTTMRTHTKNIYSKLGVHSRFEAITKAEERNI